MPKISIETTKEKDFEGVAQVLKDCKLYGPWMNKSIFKRILKRNKGLYFVAKEKGIIVGSIFSSEDAFSGHIYKLAVSPNHQGKGIGRKLIKQAVKALKARNIDWIFAHVKRGNKASIKSFKSQRINIRQDYYMLDIYL